MRGFSSKNTYVCVATNRDLSEVTQIYILRPVRAILVTLALSAINIQCTYHNRSVN